MPPAPPPSPPLLQGFPPIARADARVLVLGSMPGAASLRAGAYYAHPRNLFWPLMGRLLGAGPDLPYPKRASVLMEAGIAVWDVLARCEREGSLDSAIVDATAEANDFAGFLDRHGAIATVLFNGAKAESTFLRRAWPTLPQARLRLQRLPSTSPANASQPLDAKVTAWREALEAAGIATRD